MTTSVRVAFGPRRLAHANFWVSDVERSLRFYRDVCGLVQVFDEPGIGAVFLSNGNSHHDLALMQAMDRDRIGREGQVQIPSTVGNHPGLNHLGFEMRTEADLVGAYHRAKAAGITMRTVNHQISHSIYVHDPDGNYLEFYADATDDWREVYRDCENELLTQPWDPEAIDPDARERFAESPEIDAVDEASIHPLYTARAALHVDDLDRGIEFYTDVLGMTVLHRDDTHQLAVLAGSTGVASVELVGTDRPSGLHHFGLEVATLDELHASLSRLQEADVPVTALVEKSDKVSFVLTDPDGMRVEFFVTRPSDQPFSIPDGIDAAFAL